MGPFLPVALVAAFATSAAHATCPAIHTTAADFLPGWESGRASQGDGNFTVLNGSGGELSLKVGGIGAGLLQAWTTSGPPQLANTYFGHDSSWGSGSIFVVPGQMNGSTAGANVAGAALQQVALGSWGSAGAAPIAADGVGTASSEGYVFAVGGITSGTTATSAVYSAPITGAGTVGSWTSLNPLPAARGHAAVTALSGFVYCIGGMATGGTSSNTVYYASINAIGQLGSWQTGATLGTPVNRARAVGVGTTGSPGLANGRLVVAGGATTGTSTTNIVNWCQVTAAGAPVTWATTAALPGSRAAGALVYEAGFLVYIGGISGTASSSTPLTNVYQSTLGAQNGISGSWTAANQALPVGIFGHSANSSDGYIYVFGGSTGTFGTPAPVSTVYRSQMNLGAGYPNSGQYTNRFDLGSDTAVNQLTWQTLTGACNVGIPGLYARYRLATSGNTYGGWSAWTTTSPINISLFGQYVEYQLRMEGQGGGGDNLCVDYVQLVCGTVIPTQTNTLTYTVTRTSTPTRTITLTRTSTATRTNSGSPTVTRTPTLSGSPTASRTSTSTRSSTSTATITMTPSETRTRTQTPTWTETPTATETHTYTITTGGPTLSFTPSETDTMSPTSTLSLTPTITETPCATRTETATATESATATPTLAVFVGPNPVSLAAADYVVFQGLDFTQDAVRIFTVAGDFVAAPIVTGNPNLLPFGNTSPNPNAVGQPVYGDETRWDLTNHEGNKVAPGVYYYVVERKQRRLAGGNQVLSWRGVLIVTK